MCRRADRGPATAYSHLAVQAEVRARAHALWEQPGRPSSRDLEFRLQVERELSESENE
ncbi:MULTISPECIES: DUF2934 domain-containing protein [Bradyrhizobium]|uniref:DUF2934 domain-containing protein n=1 Tax=Bradyrhizobium TaxID=374 RepID=UPI0009E4AC0E